MLAWGGMRRKACTSRSPFTCSMSTQHHRTASALDCMLLAEAGSRPHLLQRVKVLLHALDGHILAVAHALRLEHLREGTLALLGHQAVLCMRRSFVNRRPPLPACPLDAVRNPSVQPLRPGRSALFMAAGCEALPSGVQALPASLHANRRLC